MPIAFTCPHCGTSTTVADQYAGQTGPCASCGKQITIPFTPAGKTATATKSSSATIPIVIGVLLCSVVALLACGGILAALLLPAVQSAREAARRAQCQNNLKQLALAMHNYHDVYQSLPPAHITDENGRPMHSWRTLILPFIASNPLFEQYDFDKPWNSPENQAVVQTPMHVYKCPSTPGDATQTNYMVVVGPESAFPPGEAISFRDITDGSSNTLLIVEVPGMSVPWAEPRDVTPQELLNAVSTSQSAHPGIFMVSMADGSVRAVSLNIDQQTLQAMITRNGGETIRDF